MRSILFFTSIIGVLAIVCGGYFVEFILHYTPCALCFLQRLAMLLFAISLWIFWKTSMWAALGSGIFALLFGVVTSLRHIALKFCSVEGMIPVILGKNLPVWALYFYILALLGVAIVLVFNIKDSKPNQFLQTFSFILIVIVVFFGMISAGIVRGISI